MKKSEKDLILSHLKWLNEKYDDFETNCKLECVMAYITFDGWIPISKAVPDEEGEYLTTTIHGSVYCDHWNGECFERTETVIAWMEKPDPYLWRNDPYVWRNDDE